MFATEEAGYYGPLVVLIGIAVAFGFGTLLATTIVGPRRQGKVKDIPYESGVNPVGTARRRFHVRFYIVAMAFLLFDVEVVFLFPWATVFPSLAEHSAMRGLFMGRVAFFVLTGVIAYVYAWRKGVFRYD